MPGVSLKQHFARRPVVLPSRCRRAALCALLVTCGASASAAAAAAPEIAPLVSPRRHEYSLLLGASYVLAPFLALGVGGGLSRLGVGDTLAVLSGTSMFLLPAVVHAANGNGEHAPLAFFATAGTTLLGAFVGGGVGYFIGYSRCPDHDSEECDLAGMNELVVGALLGGVVGYSAYAIADVVHHASVVREKPQRPPEAALSFWLRPRASRERRQADAGARWDGLQLGVTWSL
jgi:hypothetical protein